jgi:hypothetical protein
MTLVVEMFAAGIAYGKRLPQTVKGTSAGG